MIIFTLLLSALFFADHCAGTTAHSKQTSNFSRQNKPRSPSSSSKKPTADTTTNHSGKDPSRKTQLSPSDPLKPVEETPQAGGNRPENTKKNRKDRGMKSKKVRTYNLTVDYKTVNFTGKKTKAMAVNGSIPAPALYFKEGEMARIHVKNKMDVETSIHWHGILLPNFQDGVPYLTTPPIEPGKTHTFTFPLKQAGTYWYHSHTGLQEQRGIYGAVVIEPKKTKWRDLVLVLSDWTDENPKEILRNLKRGSEWHSIKKDTTQSLDRVIRGGALGAQLRLWRQRMPGMDISDVYYPAFLINGKKMQTYPRFSNEEPVRLRVINASASTYFWLSFGGSPPVLISADGLNIQPVPAKKILHAIGETYDFLLTPPKGKAVEFLAVAQDGSGSARALIGKGKLLKAPVIPKPDLIEQMKNMSHNHGKMTEKHSTHNHGKTTEKRSTHNHDKTMKKRSTHNHGKMMEKHSTHNHGKTTEKHSTHSGHTEDRNPMGERKRQIPLQTKPKNNPTHKNSIQRLSHTSPKGENSPSSSSYKNLRALKNTNFALPVREIKLNLTGNMWRYVWSLNGKTLSESDKIKIRKNEIIRLILHNKTMMHHPMHLHGHFFRVLNGQGGRSPLKHTVDIPPMKTVTLEFAPNEIGDWFFHCHILYHMQSGMSRVFQTGNLPRAPGLKGFPASRVLNKDRKWYSWGELGVMTNRADLALQTSNTRNKLSLTGTFSWFSNRHTNYEGEGAYERFLTDFFRVYVGGSAENSVKNQDNPLDVAGKVGIRYLLPYFIELDVNLDWKKRLEIEIEYELLLFPRLEISAEWAYKKPLSKKLFTLSHDKGEEEQEWSLELDYIMSRDFSLTAGWSNHFGYGAGILYRF